MFNFLFPRIKLVLKGNPRVVIRGLDKVPAAAMEAVNASMRTAARLIVIRMKDKMQGTKSGSLYVWKKAEGNSSGDEYSAFIRGGHGKLFPVVARGVNHRASAPGEAPAIDTRGSSRKSLYKSINWRQTVKMAKFMQAEVGVDWNAPYGRHLEYGTMYMKARPMLFPAVREEINSGNMLRNINTHLTRAGFKALR